jgi:hypothetical protein
MSQRTAPRRHQAIDPSRATDQVEDSCRPLACAKSWLYKWRNRYDAPKAAGAPERPQRPKNPPTQTPAHVVGAVVSLHLPLRHNGTGDGVPAIMQALAQQGSAPVPSRRTLYRMVRRHHMQVK